MAYTTIDNPELYFQTVTYTGNATARTITLDGSEDMQPDWVWGKIRSEAQDHVLVDSVRGATKQLYSSDTSAEQTESQGLTGFASDGFTLGTHAYFNKNTATYVAWNWKAGGSASSNSNGDITSNVSANTTAGFSIVSYTGTGSNATVGHGLGSAPGWFVTKSRDTGTEGWMVFHQSLGATKGVRLNETANAATVTAYFNDTAPTSSVFTVGTNDVVNKSGDDYIAYVFTEKKGYSSFGSYNGNGNADGAFVYTGFKPAWVLLKQTDSAGSWNLYDNKRNGFNVDNDLILTDASNAEANATFIDFLSNGFKIRDTDDDRNASNGTYIFMAFAESPFVNSNGVPNNAR